MGSYVPRLVSPITGQPEAAPSTGYIFEPSEKNMARWKERFARIESEIAAIPPDESSSRFLRDRQFWSAEGLIQPGKVVGWIFATEEKGARMK